MRYVQFADEAEAVIITVFSCEQDSEYYLHQGVVEDDDPRYLAFIDNFPG